MKNLFPTPKNKVFNVVTRKHESVYCPYCACHSCALYNSKTRAVKKRLLLKFLKNDKSMGSFKDSLIKMIRQSNDLDETADITLANYMKEGVEECDREQTPPVDQVDVGETVADLDQEPKEV